MFKQWSSVSVFTSKLRRSGSKSTNAAQDKRAVLPTASAPCDKKLEKEEDTSSDVASEAGTYTIDKDSPEVADARQSIDNVFGLQSNTTETEKNQLTKENCINGATTWINEWASSVVEHNSHSSLETTLCRTNGVSKIPSPVMSKSRLPPMTKPMRGDFLDKPLRPALVRKSYPITAHEVSKIETESYLWATEKAMSAIAARVSLALDSGGESDAENSLGLLGDQPAHTDSSASASESGHATRYNRTVSLRRQRLETTKKKEATSTTVASKTKVELAKSVPARLSKREPPLSPSSFTRTDCGRFSMRTPRPLSQTSQISTLKKEVVVKKKSNGSGGARSNSTLSSKEVEFQNWKRRKSYDPMKAAAEGKKKETAKKQPPSVMTQSTNSTITTPKSPVNPVLRSASFHGTRHLTVSSSDEGEEEEEITLSAEDDDWPTLQAPRTSLENTPQGSRLSLYSNTSNSPTLPLKNRPKLEGVDTLVINALAGLSSKLKGSSCNLLNKLRYLYDEESPKSHQLSAMIDQLEASEPGSPQVKSPSRELATTLRNLKRLESMLKVLDDVLFDKEEFQ